MTKVLKMLGGMGLAAVLGITLFGATIASAESPPNPPSRFAGSVLVNGVAPAAGTSVEARVGATTCGVTTTFNSGSESRYVIDVPALDPGATPNCGTDGATVTFFVGGQQAQETGAWHNYQLTELDLTVVTATATATATPSGTPGTGTPGAGTPTTAASATPKPPSTGSGTTSDSSTAILLFAALGLGAFAFGVGGVAVARRSR